MPKQNALEENAMLMAAFDCEDQAAIITDNKGKIFLANHAAKALFQWVNDDIFGKHLTELVPSFGNLDTLISTDDLAILRNKKKISFTSKLVLKDDSTLSIAIASTPVYIQDRYIGHVTTFVDQSQTEGADLAKTEFVSIMSHQLRTPVSAISWLSELLLDTSLSEEQRDYLTEIHISDRHLAEIISDMSAVSLLELGKFPLNPQPINLASMAHMVLESELKLLGPGWDFKISEHYDKSLPAMTFDREAFRDIVQTLISNALRYTPNGGKIKISINLDHTKISPASKGSILLEVTDTGRGIPSVEQNQIFTKLFRSSNIKEISPNGIGLALYTAKAIAEHVGGLMWFDSEENIGSTFSVLLPIEGISVIENNKTYLPTI